MGGDDPPLVDIRKRGQDAGTAEDWEALLALEAELRADEAWWPIVWAPACAMAAAKIDRRAQARSFVEEAIAGGFSQPELYDPTFTEALSGDPEWPRLKAAMKANEPPSPVTLLDWPVLTPSAPLSLDRLPVEREELLRVDAGERFACVEYTAVLSQALNAVGIPARVVAVLQASYHTGVGKAHQVSEAWIDELATWVVLDGQNGLYWVDEDAAPLGVPALQDRCRAGEPLPGYVCVGSKQLPERQAPRWFSHFRHGHYAQPRGHLPDDTDPADPDVTELAGRWRAYARRPARP